MIVKKYGLHKCGRMAATGFGFLVFGLGTTLLGLFFTGYHFFAIAEGEKQLLTRKIISQACRYYIHFLKFLGLLIYEPKPIKSRQIHEHLAKEHPIKGRLIVANHPTLLDAIYLLSLNPNLCCVVKASLFYHPITAQAVRLAGYISNDHPQFIQQAIAKLEGGDDLLIFPEGTRTKSDRPIQFKRGAANIAILGDFDIIPLVIDCDPVILQKGTPWYQVPDRAATLSITSFPVTRIASTIDTSRPRTIQYRHLTFFLQRLYNDYFQSKRYSGCFQNSPISIEQSEVFNLNKSVES